MGKTEDTLKNLIIHEYGTLKDFAPKTGIPYQTIYTILTRGIKNAGISNVIAICRALNISADALIMNNQIEPAEPESNKDLQLAINYMVYNAEIDGIPLTDSEQRKVSDTLSFVIEQIRKDRCEK